MPRDIYTIGHSTLGLDDFIALLREHEVDTLVDVRAFPGSRRHPHFNKESLQAVLPEAGMQYVHLRALGGRRGKSKDDEPSPNVFWENPSFRNYADYALTDEFLVALLELEQMAVDATCAIMCSEAVWWRCHRRIITDYLLADGVAVFHIAGKGKAAAAEMSEAARGAGSGRLIYDKVPGGQSDLFGTEHC